MRHILSRRGRAKVGALLGVLFVVFALPAATAFYSWQQEYATPQSTSFTLDDVPNDAIFPDALKSYDNTTGTWTYSRPNTGDLTSDVVRVDMYFRDASGDYVSATQSITGYDGKIFFVPSVGSYTWTDQPACCPTLWVWTALRPDDLINGSVSEIDVYIENGVNMGNISVDVVVKSDAQYGTSPEVVIGSAVANVSCDGHTISVPLSETQILTAKTKYRDGYVFLRVVDKDGNQITPSHGMYLGMTVSGADTLIPITAVWHGALAVIGLVGIVAGLFATPFVGFESISSVWRGAKQRNKRNNKKKIRRSRR